MPTNKNSLIALMKACAKDPEVLNGSPTWFYIREGANDNTRYFYTYMGSTIWGGSKNSFLPYGFSFTEAPEDRTSYKTIQIELRFDKEPSIYIHCDSNSDSETSILPAKKYWFIDTSVECQKITYKPKYIISCDSFRFDLKESEMKEIYDLIIEERRLHRQNEIDKQMVERYKKYNIEC